MRSSPPVRLPYTTVHSHLGELWLPHIIFLGQAPPSPPPALPPRTPSVEEQPPTAVPPMPMPKQSPRLRRWLPSLEPIREHTHGQSHPGSYVGGPLLPKKWETPPSFKSLKPGHAEAFLRDSNIMVEARLCFFPKHSYNFVEDSNCNLSRIFKKLALSAGLLGTNIHEIEASWTVPEELKQANYTLRSLLKGLKFLRTVLPWNLLKSWG